MFDFSAIFAFVDEIHFCGDNVKALLPDSFLKASNSSPLKLGFLYLAISVKQTKKPAANGCRFSMKERLNYDEKQESNIPVR